MGLGLVLIAVLANPVVSLAGRVLGSLLFCIAFFWYCPLMTFTGYELLESG